MSSHQEVNALVRRWLADHFPRRDFGHVIASSGFESTEGWYKYKYTKRRWSWKVWSRGQSLARKAKSDGHEVLTLVQLDGRPESARDVTPLAVYVVPISDILRYRPNVKVFAVKESKPGSRKKTFFLEPYAIDLGRMR